MKKPKTFSRRLELGSGNVIGGLGVNGKNPSQWYSIGVYGYAGVLYVDASGDYANARQLIQVNNIWNTAGVKIISRFDYGHKNLPIEYGMYKSGAEARVAIRLNPAAGSADFAGMLAIYDAINPSSKVVLTPVAANDVALRQNPTVPDGGWAGSWSENYYIPGNLGLGTSNPVGHAADRKALIIDGSNQDALLELWGNNGGKAILQSVGGNTYMGTLAKGSGAGDLYLISGKDNQFGTIGATIQGTSGNVGIGTTTPTAKLDVAGDAKVSGNLTVNGSPVLTASSANVARLDQSPVFTPSGSGAYNEGIRVSDAPNGYSLLKLGGSGSTGTTLGSWTLYKDPSGNFNMDNGAQRQVHFTADRNRFTNALVSRRMIATGNSNIENYGIGGAWTGAAFATNSIEIVNNDGVVNNSSPTLAFHRYGSGGPQFRLAADGSNVLYLESAGANSATQPTAPVETFFNKLQVSGGLGVAGDASVSGTLSVKKALRVPPSGDLGMGTFTTGTNPSL